MSGGSRSILVLGTAFAGVVLLTLGIAGLLVPQHRFISGEPQGSGETGRPQAVDEGQGPVQIPGLGGDLTVSGDREGTFSVSLLASGPLFGVRGEDGQILFDTDPFGIAQLDYDGLLFYPDDGHCTVTPGDLTDAIGTAPTEIVCEEIADVRGGGVVTFAGTIGLPVNVLAGINLPSSGGSVDVGGETWSFENAELFTWRRSFLAGSPDYQMELTDEARRASLNFTYDAETQALALALVRVGEDRESVPEGACEFQSDELGTRDTRTTVLELTIECAGVTVPGMGEVSISGTVIVDRLEFPA